MGKVIAEFLTHRDPRIRADAGNALARLRAGDGNEQLRKLLTSDSDPIVVANAARVLGATEHKAAFDGLLDRALKDTDLRVRVIAIRALAALKDSRAANPLLTRAQNKTLQSLHTEPGAANEALEIATTLGRLLEGSENVEALEWLLRARNGFKGTASEIEIALSRISPAAYLSKTGAGMLNGRKAQAALMLNWKSGSSLAQGLGAIAALPDSTSNKTTLAGQALEILRAMLDYSNMKTSVTVHPEYAIPDVLRALAAFKPGDLQNVLFSHLNEPDVIIRATAAELLAELPPGEAIAKSLITALPTALNDKELNDAALAVLDALGKQKTPAANEAIKSALDSSDHLVRRRAVALLKANGAGDFSARIGTVQP
ncbi:MAG: HEAT repeat domain-containing protein, partial [Burkholderiales bacterium]